MLKRICDRCRNEIKANYWIIDIYEKQDNMGRLTLKGAANNIQHDIDKAFRREKEYCKNCIDKIKEFIENEQSR